MLIKKFIKIGILLTIVIFTLNSCGRGGDARKNSPDPKERVKKNLEEGRGFRLNDIAKRGLSKGGDFEFASSNVLWRASIDSIDFMPLASANYSGGIIITDWYSANGDGESIKISIRFLTNEVRSDALDIKVFSRKCNIQSSCITSEKYGNLIVELKSKILKTAAIYKKKSTDENFTPYVPSNATK